MKRKKFERNDRSRKSLEKRLRTISESILRVAGLKKTIRWFDSAHHHELVEGKKTDIFLLPHREMVRLKKKFLPHEKGLSNVLAFPEPKHWPHPEKKDAGLGEIYLNRDLAKGDIGELSRLLIHGMLHLLGYDHKKKSDRIKMEKMEKALFTHIL